MTVTIMHEVNKMKKEILSKSLWLKHYSISKCNTAKHYFRKRIL